MSRAQLGAWKEKGEVRGWGSAGAPGAGALHWDSLAWPGMAQPGCGKEELGRQSTGKALDEAVLELKLLHAQVNPGCLSGLFLLSVLTSLLHICCEFW